MWQARQTLANNSSPLISTNLKPALNPEGELLCAYAMDADSSESATDIAVAKAVRRVRLLCIISITLRSRLVFQLLTTRSCSRLIASRDDRIAPSCHAGM